MKDFWGKLKEALLSVLPIVGLVAILYISPLLYLTSKEFLAFLISAFFLIFGVGLFNLGADLAMTPMGEHIGAGLTKAKSKLLLLCVCFAMGVLITVAEPDLSVLAAQLSSSIDGTLLIVCVGGGVGLFLVLAVLKIVYKKSLPMLLLFFYMMLFAIASLAVANGNGNFLPIAFDSGGVTTGPITVPFIMAMGVGLAMSLGGGGTGENSFGIVAMCSIGPILSVLLLGLSSGGGLDVPATDYSLSSHLGENFIPTVLGTAKDVIIALGLIVLFFIVLQAIFLKLPKTKLYQMGIGIVYTFFGLVIFLTAAKVGFMPVGYKIGMQIAENSPTWLVIIGFIVGTVVVLAEPAVHVLNSQVENVTDGRVSKTSMMVALSVGVGISIALSVLREIFDFSLLYYIIPGYLVSLGLSFFVPGIYTAIAFDSGGVASGPLTSSFILPFAIGACVILGGEEKILDDAFGVVAMVAMTPLITIQFLGFRSVITRKLRENIAMRRILGADDEQIIEFM